MNEEKKNTQTGPEFPERKDYAELAYAGLMFFAFTTLLEGILFQQAINEEQLASTIALLLPLLGLLPTGGISLLYSVINVGKKVNQDSRDAEARRERKKL